jgi:hypothetical protein
MWTIKFTLAVEETSHEEKLKQIHMIVSNAFKRIEEEENNIQSDKE